MEIKKIKIIESEFDATPDKSLMRKMGKASGYSIPEALYELNDNSIDARNTEELLKILNVFNMNGKNSSIEVIDNAEGMNEQELKDATIMAKSKKHNALGEFGLGLKSASLRLGRNFIITTAKKGNPFIYSIEFDLDDWENNPNWKLFTRKEPNEENFSGTKIKIQKLDEDCLSFFSSLQNGKIRNHIKDLSERYSPFLPESVELKVKINEFIFGTEPKKKTFTCEPVKIELVEKEEFKNIEIYNSFIHGWIGLRVDPKGNYGFNTYRYNRMIEKHSKIGFLSTAPGFHERYIIGEIHMDKIPVTSTKREWIHSSTRYVAVEKEMRKKVKRYKEKAKVLAEKDALKKKYKKIPTKELHSILSKIIESAEKNSSLDISSLEFEYEQNLNGCIEGLTEIESRNKREIEGKKTETKKSFETKSRIPKKRVLKKTHSEKRLFLKIHGKKYKFIIDICGLGKKASCKIWDQDKTTGVITIVINGDHPILTEMKSRKGMFYLLAKYLAEVVCESNYGKKSNEIRDNLLYPVLPVIKQMKI